MSDFLFSADTLAAVLVGMIFASIGTLVNHYDATPYLWFRTLVSNATAGAGWAIVVYGGWYTAQRNGYPLANRPELLWGVLVTGSLAAPTVMYKIKNTTRSKLL